MTGGKELSALVGNGATMHVRAWGERGNDDELTAVPMVLLKGSGGVAGSESTLEVRRPEVEDDGVGGDAELGEASASAEMTRATRRS